MRICLVTPFSSEGSGGGITNHLRLTAEGLIERGHEVTVISGFRDLPGEAPCAIRGARTAIVKGAPGDTFSPEFWSRSAETFRGLNAEIKFDVILSEGSSALGLLRLGTGIPVAAFVHQFKAIHLFNSFQEVSTPRLLAIYALRTVPYAVGDALRAEIPFLRKADGVICGADHIRRAVGKFYGLRKEKMATVRYWTDTTVFRPGRELGKEGRRLLGVGEDDFIFLTAGRLQETKGIDTALRAFSRLPSPPPGTKLAIVGGGVPGQLENHRRIASDLGISDRVLFTGLVPAGDLPALYNAADVFLMPSKLIEAGPYTLLEAMSCGRAIIASKRPGSVEMMGENGFYHAPGDAEELSGLMKKLRGDAALRLRNAEENLERSRTVFDKKTALERLENLLGKLAADGKGTPVKGQRTGGAFFKDAALMLANNLLLLAVSMLSGVLIARGLGPEGKGLYSIALLFPTLLAGLGSLGLNFANIYFLNKDADNRPYIAGSSLLYSVAAGTVLALLVAVLSGVISARFLGGAGAAYIIAAAPLVLLLMLVENIFHFFMASREIKNIFIYTTTRNVSHLLIIAAFCFSGSLTVLKTLFSQAAALAAALIFGVSALKTKGFFSGTAWRWPVFRKMLAFGLKQHVGTAAQMLNYRIDMFIAAALLSPYQVGLYSVSVSMAELLWHIANSAGQVLYPKIAGSDRSAADRFTPDVARHVFFLTLASAAALWAAANPLTGLLFGRDFLPATAALKLLLPGVVLLSVSKVIGSDISARGYPHYNSAASVISLVTAAALNLLLIPRYGLAGAAMATSASYLANSAVMLYFFRKVSGAGLTAVFLPKKNDLVFYGHFLATFFKRA